jgi:flagellar biosynthetic protein FlhB
VSDKTEAPTGRRVSEARNQGQVARSQELNVAVALLLGIWLVTGPGKNLGSALKGLVIDAITGLPTTELTGAWLRQRVVTDLWLVAPGLGLIVLGMLATGLTVTVGQTGFLWASKRIGFDFSRLNLLNGLKRLFSGQGLLELFKALLKLTVVGWISYSFLKTRLIVLLGLSQTNLVAALQTWGELAVALALRVSSAYFVLAVVDYAYQRWQITRNLRMTKQEVKEDMKRSEGDPMLRGRIRGQQRRMARMRMMSNVPKADVIITNPTHLAIAIQYDPETMRAPKVLAKGAHRIAARIVEIARANSVPVMQNIPLARAIYPVVEIDQEIPPELYMAMAEVLAYVFKLRQQAFAPQ